MIIFELGTDPDNVHEWDFEAGIREFIQGYLDNKNGGEWKHEGDSLILKNYNTKLERKTLLAGYSTKRNDSSQRGKFGDGLTSGICVLLREGLDITIYNQDVIWKPIIVHSEQFDHDVLAIEETVSEEVSDSYTVVIDGVNDYMMECVIENTLSLQGEYKNYPTRKGTILLEDKHKGRIYVGGLFVDHFDSDYGFDFPPECFSLDRDRKSLKPFDIQWQTKDLIAEMSSKELDEDLSDRLVENLFNNDKSTEYMHEICVSSNESLKNSAEKLYKEKYDGMIITSSHEEADKLKEDGNKNVAFVRNKSFVTLVQKSESHQVVFGARKEQEEISSQQLLDNFEDEWQYEMGTELYEAWRELADELKERM